MIFFRFTDFRNRRKINEFEERMKGVLKEIEDSKEMIVLFVDEIHLLMGAGSSGEGGMDAANHRWGYLVCRY